MTKFTLVPNSLQQLADTKGITLYTPTYDRQGKVLKFKITRPTNS